MAKKMVTDRSADASLLSAAAAIFMREVSPALGGVLSPLVGEGEPVPDLTTLPVLASRLVDQRLTHAQAELIEPRKRRDDAFGQASDTIYRVRDVCRGLYGPELCARIVPDERRIPQRPKAFLHTGEHVLERLRDAERSLPSKQLVGVEVERVELSTNFGADLEKLRESLAEVDLQSREAEITQAAKDEAMREFDVTYRAAIKLLEASAILAGKPELAGRVRPTRRSSAKKAGPATEETVKEEPAPVADSDGSTDSTTESVTSAG